MLEYRVSARRIDCHGSEATTKNATVALDTDVNGRPDAFNPAELFLAAGCRVHDQGHRAGGANFKFAFRGVEVKLQGVR